MVRYAECEAAAAGAVRATHAAILDAPRRCGHAVHVRRAQCTGTRRRGAIWFVTWAPRKEACVKCCALRLTRSPFTNVFREAVVTACVLWAYT